MEKLRILTNAEDIGPEFEAHIADALDWFDGEPRLNTEDFIDRLCNDYGDGWDIESYDNPAVRKIMRLAREMRARG